MADETTTFTVVGFSYGGELYRQRLTCRETEKQFRVVEREGRNLFYGKVLQKNDAGDPCLPSNRKAIGRTEAIALAALMRKIDHDNANLARKMAANTELYRLALAALHELEAGDE